MDVANITAENIAKAVGGTVERGNNVLCRCPIHEASGTHSPSLLLTITKTRRILFHCQSQKCDAQHFRTIRDHLVETCGLPRSHVGGNRADEEARYNYHHLAWKWQRRPQPLSELYLDAFFGKCFGMYAAVRRHGLDRASKRDVSYCTTWLRERGWRHIQKRLPDGQRCGSVRTHTTK